MNKIILTGDRPTGKLHLGHYIGSLKKRVELQDEYKEYILIADMQAMTDNAEEPEKIRKNVFEVVLDYLAIGINPEKATICLQSQLPALSELTMYYLNLVTLARLQRNPTVKDEMKQRGYGANVPVGFLTYPVSQAADITAFKAGFVPVGEDQLPVLEQTNEIVRKFNSTYKTNVLVSCRPILSEVGRLPGIDGTTKMSKSLDNAINLSDSSDDIKRKVMAMYTDPGHIRAEDPGQIEGNPVFVYLDAFDPDKKEVENLKDQYKKGGLGDVKVKEHLIEVLQSMISPIRGKREELQKDMGYIKKVLEEGTLKAREITDQTLKEAKDAMGINYFS